MSAEYDVARQQRLRRALEAIADAYGFTGGLRRERIGEWWLFPNSIGYDREQRSRISTASRSSSAKSRSTSSGSSSPRPSAKVPEPDPRRHGRRFLVVDVVRFDEEDETPFVGPLQLEAA